MSQVSVSMFGVPKMTIAASFSQSPRNLEVSILLSQCLLRRVVLICFVCKYKDIYETVKDGFHVLKTIVPLFVK